MGAFRSYDIRGVYPTELDAPMARKIGVAYTRYLAALPENQGKRKLRLVVGRDMRLSAPEMAAALIDGMTAAGADVFDIGMVTTPCSYFAIQRLEADGGVMCTASHNPPQYIGFKVCRELAIPISYDAGLKDIEQLMDWPEPTGPKGAATPTPMDDAYIDFLVGMANIKRPLKVAADAANGMAGKYLEKLFQRLGCELVGIFLDPDGRFPNHEADPLKAENLKPAAELTARVGAAVGFSYDGDADRVAVVDETGAAVGCDLVTALLAKDVLASRPGAIATYDLRSSMICRDVIEQAGGSALRVRVGHSHVKRTMREVGAVVGGELSGHYYFQLKDKHLYYADSALVATIRLLNLLSSGDMPMSGHIAPMRVYSHTGEINFAIADKTAAMQAVAAELHDGDVDHLDGVTITFPNWWVNVRPSNTEPLLRLTLEGRTRADRDVNYARVLKVLEGYGHVASSAH